MTLKGCFGPNLSFRHVVRYDVTSLRQTLIGYNEVPWSPGPLYTQGLWTLPPAIVVPECTAGGSARTVSPMVTDTGTPHFAGHRATL